MTAKAELVPAVCWLALQHQHAAFCPLHGHVSCTNLECSCSFCSGGLASGLLCHAPVCTNSSCDRRAGWGEVAAQEHSSNIAASCLPLGLVFCCGLLVVTDSWWLSRTLYDIRWACHAPSWGIPCIPVGAWCPEHLLYQKSLYPYHHPMRYSSSVTNCLLQSRPSWLGLECAAPRDCITN